MASRLRAHLPRTASFARALRERVRREDGIALLMALGMMIVLGILVASTISYVTSNSDSANTSNGRTNAFTLAEAGMNDAISKLSAQIDSNGDIVGIDPKTATLLSSTTIPYPSVSGSVTYSGTIDANYVWKITSTGTITHGGQVQKHTITRNVTVYATNNGSNASAWSRFYQNSATPCLTIDTETFVTNVATRGNLCIDNTGAITGATTKVDVGGTVVITGPPVTSPAHSPSAGAGWTAPTNVYSSDGVSATNIVAAASTGANQDTTGFGFAIPSASKILGISASVRRMASACCNAVQTITTSGSPTGGTFKLQGTPPSGSNTVSASIAFNASAVTIQAALVTIYGSGNVTCGGGALPTGVVCTFGGSDALKAVYTMSQYSNGLTGGSSPKSVYAVNTTGGSLAALQDNTVQLLKAGSPVGSNKASGSGWPTSLGTVTYGTAADLWGTTWTPADVNASNFGLRFAAKNIVTGSSTASLDYVSITVSYTDDTNGIGTPGTPIASANIGGSCTYNAQAAHTPCTSTDHVYANNITTVAPASNPALDMPTVDFNYWWKNAAPGPKHFCTNPSPGLSTTFFDNDASTTTGPNKSLTVNGEMAPLSSDYTCQVWSIPPTSGQLLGELSWNHTTHVLKIAGTIFVDGNFRFDNDGQVVNYFGRATMMSSKDDEIDALVCAGGTGTTDSNASCLSNMASWNTSQNMMVLMSQEDNEYDQGGTTCSGNTPPTCYNGHPPGGFQGILYSTADCLIHQNFQDSGPVICNTITLPNEGGINPTFYPFPSTGDLTDGQKYSDPSTSTHWLLKLGTESG
jgi:Tfp pilus assembly protein PilX